MIQGKARICIANYKTPELIRVCLRAIRKFTDYPVEVAPVGRRRYHNRTICCLYRTDILKKEALSFLPNPELKMTTGAKLYMALADRGYRTVELPVAKIRPNILHLTHATQITNPKEFPLAKRTFKKWSKIINKQMAAEPIRSLLTDDSLDK